MKPGTIEILLNFYDFPLDNLSLQEISSKLKSSIQYDIHLAMASLLEEGKLPEDFEYDFKLGCNWIGMETTTIH